MLQLKIYTDVVAFYNDTYDLLMCHEAQNLIPLGNIIIGKKGEDKSGWRDPANWFMATVSDNKDIQLVAIMTPPHNITLYAKDNRINEAAVSCLIEHIGVPVPGVMARKDMATYFAQEYCSAKKVTCETAMEQRIYELTEVLTPLGKEVTPQSQTNNLIGGVINPEIPHKGKIRLAEESDMYFIPYWLEAFYSAEVFGSTTMNIPQNTENCLSLISQKKLFILEENGKPVSIAGLTREMQNVCGVGYVYTPPYFRKRGYATSCVAKLSRLILDRGFSKCVLYTDLANPTSNSIYQAIGYRPICDSVILKFKE
ncbi:MAG: GNAT family N-acetyltransferase [Defluviitaleaceae bacterium]|nr:GNAT family N-acetyltransferase [Defluviitaleaceae bacterium]